MSESSPDNPAIRTVDDLIVRDELERSTSREPDFAAENRALLELTKTLATDPAQILPTLARLILELCRAGSAGVSVLEPGGTSGIICYRAVVGALASFQGDCVPREVTPCGTVMARKQPLVFDRPERMFPLLRNRPHPVRRILIVPWEMGTAWAILHEPERRFDGEDARLVGNLSSFCSAAYGLLARVRRSDEMRAERSAALNLVEDAIAARKEAETATRAKDHFLAILSHELRTPLTPVNLTLRRLLRRTDFDQAAKDALGLIQRNVDLESRLIDDLLDLTRISRGTLEIIVAPLGVHEVIRDAIEVVLPEIESKRQRLTVQLEAKQAAVQGDAARLQQVYWNVLRNASKFTPDGGEIVVSSRDEKGRLLVEVRDTGIGFGPTDAQTIFEAFVQATSTGRRYGGLGLGLAISRATIEAHGGTIAAHSAGENQGAVFTINLPLANEG